MTVETWDPKQVVQKVGLSVVSTVVWMADLLEFETVLASGSGTSKIILL